LIDWRKRLRPASFRGVAFFVEKEEIADGGRHVGVHEYVRAEEHDTEDMGRKATRYRATAYVVGDRAEAEHSALFRACVEPGAASLVLPMFGARQARCTSVKTAHEKNKLGYIAFDIEWVDKGKGAPAALPLGDRLAAAAFSGFATAAGQAMAGLGAFAPGAVGPLSAVAQAAAQGMVDDVGRLPIAEGPSSSLSGEAGRLAAQSSRVASAVDAGAFAEQFAALVGKATDAAEPADAAQVFAARSDDLSARLPGLASSY